MNRDRINIPAASLFLAVALFTACAFAQGPTSDKYPTTLAKDFLMDAPWRVVDADTPIPVTIIIKDSDVDDVRQLHWCRIEDTTSGTPVTIWQHNHGDERLGDDPSEHNFWVWITTVTENHPSLPNGTLLTPANLGYTAGDVIVLTVKVYYKDDVFNYTEQRVLHVNVGQGPFPWPAGWYGGDVHYHTMYTNNLYEFGGPLPAAVLTAQAMGLHWLTTTDHSCDLDETGDGTYSYATLSWEYTIQDQGGIATVYRDNVALGSAWAALGAEVALLDSPTLRLIRGAEVNLASIDPTSTGKTLHCLIYNPVEIVSSNCGAPGERPVTPTLPVGLDQMTAEGFAYAAHPTDDLGAEVLGFDWGINGAVYGNQDYQAALARTGFVGMEVFNTRATVTSLNQNNPWADFAAGNPADNPYPAPLLEGVARWDSLLDVDLARLALDPAGLPRKVFISGGSDAHGDFNYSSHMSVDDYALDNAMGKVQTVVRVPDPGYGPGNLPPMSAIMDAYRQGCSVATDGPFLEIGIDGDGDGGWDGPEDLLIGATGTLSPATSADLMVRWASLPEFGDVATISIRGLDGSGAAILLATLTPVGGEGLGGAQTLPVTSLSWPGGAPQGWWAVRADLETTDGLAGHRALTNPIWLFFDPNSGVDEVVAAPGARLLGNHPNPFNPTTAIAFELGRLGPVRLVIMGPDGGLVRTLVDMATFSEGPHTVTWDGLDDHGRPVGSGMYLTRLEAAGIVETGKMTLLR
ncbi:MAG: hypothetical protein ABIK96_12245 [bacterium]